MSISHVAAGTIAYSASTSISAAYPTGISANQLLVMYVNVKPASATVTTPSGWTRNGDSVGTTGTLGANAGPTRVVVFTKIATGSETGSQAVTLASANPAAVQITSWSSGTGQFSLEFFSGEDTSSNTTYSIACTAYAGALVAGDVLVSFSSLASRTPTWSATNFTATGMTMGTRTALTRMSSSTGNSLGGDTWYATVSSGTMSGTTITTSATLSANSYGPAAVLRIREASAPPVSSSISYVETAWNTAGTSVGVGNQFYKDITVNGCQVGDILLVFGIAENRYTNDTHGMADVSAGGAKTGTWTTTTGLNPVSGYDVDFHAGYAVVTSAGSITVRVVLSSNNANEMGVGAYLIPSSIVGANYDFVGSGFINDADGLSSATLTTQSLVVYMAGNWSTTNMGSTTSPSGGTIYRSFADSAYSIWTTAWLNQAAGTRQYGPAGLSAEDISGVIFVMDTPTVATSRWFLKNGTALTPYTLTSGGLIQLQ